MARNGRTHIYLFFLLCAAGGFLIGQAGGASSLGAGGGQRTREPAFSAQLTTSRVVGDRGLTGRLGIVQPQGLQSERVAALIADRATSGLERTAFLPRTRVSGWKTLMTEGFEATWPRGAWETLDDNGPTGGELYWDEDAWKPFKGSHSAWPANGGADGRNPAISPYANNMDSWMVYGPFDLRGYTAADFEFYRWNQIGPTDDRLFWGASHDGVDFLGYSVDGDSGGWQYDGLDLADYLGDSSVWIAFLFESDTSKFDDGPFIDDVKLWAFSDPAVSISPASGSESIDRLAFTLSLGWASPHPVTVSYQTLDGTAIAPDDYFAPSVHPVTFSPGQTSKTIRITIEDDAVDELDETFSVTLSQPVNATIGVGTAVGTIQDDDADVSAPVVTLPGNKTVEATEPGGSHVSFAVSAIDPPHGNPAVVCQPSSGFLFPLGSTTVLCTATDSSGNTGQGTFRVRVRDTTPPAITLLGPASVAVPVGSPYLDAGATAADIVDGDLTSVVVTANPVDTAVPGTYTVTYDVADSSGNAALQVSRTVEVAYYCNGLKATKAGTEGHDVLTGTPGTDVIVGLGGNDVIYGFGGRDTICGGPGSDEIWGGTAADNLFGEGGNDRIMGEAGADLLWGGSGNDRLQGGADSDTLNGQHGTDAADFTGASAKVTVNMASGVATGDGLLDRLVGIENLVGSSFGDVLTGSNRANTIWGQAGDDQISGGGGTDVLWGGAGNDALSGGPGTDTVDGGAGTDLCTAETQRFCEP